MRDGFVQQPAARRIAHGQQIGAAHLRVVVELEQQGSDRWGFVQRGRPQCADPVKAPTRTLIAAAFQSRNAAEVHGRDLVQHVQQRAVPADEGGLRDLLAVAGHGVDDHVPGPLQRQRDGGPMLLSRGDGRRVEELDEGGGGDEHVQAPEKSNIVSQSSGLYRFGANTFSVSERVSEPPPVLARLAANIVALRAKGNWSSSALAEQAHVARRTIQQIERGDINLSLKTLDRLARALGVTTGSLLGDRPVARREFHLFIEEVVAQNLVSARKRHDLTQERVSERSGVGRGVIAHIERQARNPSLMTLAKLAAALEVSLEALLCDSSVGPGSA